MKVSLGAGVRVQFELTADEHDLLSRMAAITRDYDSPNRVYSGKAAKEESHSVGGSVSTTFSM